MQELIDRLHELAEWADGNAWETPIDLADKLREAATEIRILNRLLEFAIDQAKEKGD